MMSDPSSEREAFAGQVLADAGRMGRGDKFQFACRPGIVCFNQCCGNVNILLTPLDVLRLARRLEMKTGDFLAEHTLVPFTESQKLPFVFLKMTSDERKSCPFVTEKGCGVYEARPWPCRMYPIGEASPENVLTQGDPFYFLVREDHCHGHEEPRTWTVGEWLDDQGVGEYQELGELFKGIILHPYLSQKPLDPAHMEMYYMACYDLDRFREFVFKSRFRDRFVLEPELEAALASDDLALLRFAFRWLRFALFGELTMKIREELLTPEDRQRLARKK
jgi:uncharacterized protein